MQALGNKMREKFSYICMCVEKCALEKRQSKCLVNIIKDILMQ